MNSLSDSSSVTVTTSGRNFAAGRFPSVGTLLCLSLIIRLEDDCNAPYVVIDLVVVCLNERLELFVPFFDLHLSNVWPLGSSELEKSKETRDIYR
jgi:hypothetical protein